MFLLRFNKLEVCSNVVGSAVNSRIPVQMRWKYSPFLWVFWTCITLPMALLDAESKKSFQTHVFPGTTIAVFNIPPVALDPRALQRRLSPPNKDSSGRCHPHKALSLPPPSCRPLKLMSRLCHFSQRAGLLSSSLPALCVVPCAAVSAPIASPSSVTPPSGVTVMDAASLSLRAHRPPTHNQQDRFPSPINCFRLLLLHCLWRFIVSRTGSNLSDGFGQESNQCPRTFGTVVHSSGRFWVTVCIAVCFLTNGAENYQNILHVKFAESVCYTLRVLIRLICLLYIKALLICIDSAILTRWKRCSGLLKMLTTAVKHYCIIFSCTVALLHLEIYPHTMMKQAESSMFLFSK